MQQETNEKATAPTVCYAVILSTETLDKNSSKVLKSRPKLIISLLSGMLTRKKYMPQKKEKIKQIQSL